MPKRGVCHSCGRTRQYVGHHRQCHECFNARVEASRTYPSHHKRVRSDGSSPEPSSSPIHLTSPPGPPQQPPPRFMTEDEEKEWIRQHQVVMSDPRVVRPLDAAAAVTTLSQLRSFSDSSLSSSAAAAAAVVVELPPLHQRDTSSINFYNRYHYALLPSTDRSQTLSRDIELAKLVDASLTIPIAGNVQQLDLGGLASKFGMTQELMARCMALAIETGQQYTHLPANRLQVRAIKLLTSKYNQGEQLIHCDHPSGFHSHGRYSFLIYITDGAPSTALWKHPHNSVHRDPKEEFKRVWNKSEYHQLNGLKQGQVLFLDESVPHYGVKNTIRRPRRVLFIQLADTDVKADELLGVNEASIDSDDYQFYEWQHAADLWGLDSLEYAEALIRNKMFNPLQNKFDLDALETALTTLKRHGKFEAYFGSNVEPTWIQQLRRQHGKAQ